MQLTWRESRVTQIIFTLLRLYVGYQWVMSGYEKVFGAQSASWVGANAGTAVTGFLQGALAKTGGAHPDVSWWYGGFIENVALPNAQVFSYLVAFGELLVGVGLILGFLTNIALLAGILMNTAYLMAGTVSTNPFNLILEVILLWGGVATYYWGIDRVFIPRWRKYRMARREDKLRTEEK